MQVIHKNMKKTIALLFCAVIGALLNGLASYAQNGRCDEVDLANDSIKKEILRDFINESIANNDFRDDKGVVRLTVYQDKQKQTHWILSATINDGFLNVNPPTKYFDFMGDLVLVWDADSVGNTIQTKGDTAILKQCLRAKIADRLYIQPPRQFRWTNMKAPNGIPRNLEGMRREKLGGGYHIIFNKDGTYVRTRMA